MLSRAFQLLGLALGGGGGMERLHWLLERAFDEDINQLNQTFTAVIITSMLHGLLGALFGLIASRHRSSMLVDVFGHL